MTRPHLLEVPPEADGVRLDALDAAVALAGSRARLQRLVRDGSVQRNGEVVPGRTRLRAGDVLSIVVPPEPATTLLAEDIPLDVVYEDDQVIVIDKAAGMVCHPAPGHPSGTLVNALLGAIPELRGVGTAQRPGLVHRLDKDTSGLMVVARTAGALRTLQRAFAQRTVGRDYLAVSLGARLDSATFDTPYGRHPKHRKRFTATAGSRRAITHVRVLWRGQLATLVQARLETGRTHQVRVHLAEAGHPIAADPLYGRPVGNPGPSARASAEARRLALAPRLLLHAAVLRFRHPADGRPMRFERPPPPDFLAILEAWLGDDWPAVWAEFRAPAEG